MTKSPLNKSNIIAIFFLFAVGGLIFRQWGFQLPIFSVNEVYQLASPEHQGFQLPNLRLDPVKEYLPEKGMISMITDHPYEVGKYEEELFYRAQNFLVPLVINRAPEEKLAIVVCSNPEIAEKRLKETNYIWIKNFNNGKGIASRQS